MLKLLTYLHRCYEGAVTSYLCSYVVYQTMHTHSCCAHKVLIDVLALSEVGDFGEKQGCRICAEVRAPPACRRSPASPWWRPSWVAKAARLSHQLNLCSLLGLQPDTTLTSSSSAWKPTALDFTDVAGNI